VQVQAIYGYYCKERELKERDLNDKELKIKKLIYKTNKKVLILFTYYIKQIVT
jgi:hypothetical protein